MSAPVPDGRLGPRVWAALLVVYVVWGSTYLAIRYSLETLPPMLSAAGRFLPAGAIMLAAALAFRGRAAVRVTRPEALTAAASGVLLLAGGNGLVVFGEQRVPSGLAALVVASVPLWIVVFRTVLRDRPAPVTLAGVLLGFAGVGLLFRPGGGGGVADPAYLALIAVAAVSWAVGSLVVARRPVPAELMVLSAVQMLAGGAVLLGVGVARGELDGFAVTDVSARSWLALGYLTLFGSVLAFTAYGWLLNRAPVSVVATYAYVNPAVAVLLGVTLAGERLTAPAVGGGLVILVAVAVVVTAESRRRSRAARPAAEAAPAADPVPAAPAAS